MVENCGALPDQLMESELFGHKRGAFTGAVEDHQGLFERASGGTVFLDEIGEISPAFQVKLLRVLQEQEIRPLGGSKTRKVDVRVIAATNRKLEDEVRAGRFRADLFYRLAGTVIACRPLRERRADIPLLAEWPCWRRPATSSASRLPALRRGAGAADRLSVAGQCAGTAERSAAHAGQIAG